ncbi:coxsackievirus and adenovirus receptor homolog [Channa argus]|uniref:coxsackievirus and adenovirus receptor homolog n=1 Tax=Channa argus TaxID=215402 RepID=UPI003520B893
MMARLAGKRVMVSSWFWIFSLISAFKVKVKTGEDVLLQCQAPRGAAIELIEWIRPDLKSDGYVFFYRDDHSYENYQHPSFQGRVELKNPQLQDGDASVILKNVTINDTGTFECFVGNQGSEPQLISTITVTVPPPGDAAGHKNEEPDGNNRGHVGLAVVKVKTGEDVLLQCQAPRGAAIELLEWIRPDLKSDGYVFFYRNDRAYKNYQHLSFHGRVELRVPQMKDGDVSVILSNVIINDTGTYECRYISSNTGGTEPVTPQLTTITLTVTDSGGGGDKDEGKTDEVTKGREEEDVNVGLVAALSVGTLLLGLVVFVIIAQHLKQAAYQLPPEKLGEQPPV